MSLRAKHRSPRGFSLIEAMMASAILIIGLTGITLMLTRGVVNGRNGQQTLDSATIVNQMLADFEAAGISSLTPTPGASFDAGTAADGGTFMDPSGRTYSMTYIVTDVTPGVPPATVLIPTYQIDVEVGYRDGTGQMIYRRGGTILSRAPDAG